MLIIWFLVHETYWQYFFIKSNIFTSVCHSVHREGVCVSQHELGQTPPGTHPLPSACWDTPPCPVHAGIHPPGGHCCGRYASYWNAFLYLYVSIAHVLLSLQNQLIKTNWRGNHLQNCSIYLWLIFASNSRYHLEVLMRRLYHPYKNQLIKANGKIKQLTKLKHFLCLIFATRQE